MISWKCYRSILQPLDHSSEGLLNCECFLGLLLISRMKFLLNFFLTCFLRWHSSDTLFATTKFIFFLLFWLALSLVLLFVLLEFLLYFPRFMSFSSMLSKLLLLARTSFLMLWDLRLSEDWGFLTLFCF